MLEPAIRSDPGRSGRSSKLPGRSRVSRSSDLEEQSVRLPSFLSISLATLAGGATIAAAAVAPTVRTGRASAVTQQTATIVGSINPHGLPTAFFFQFGPTTAYGTRTATRDAGAGTKTGAESEPLTCLRQNT